MARRLTTRIPTLLSKMPISDNDPRVFFASERTMLAWLRTGLSIIAIGFVISRFWLFSQMASLQIPAHQPPSTFLTSALGVSFVAVGSVSILISAIQHGRFIATLSPLDLPPAYSRIVGVILCNVVAMLGFFLCYYLLIN